jgi:quinol monooxygenase YgiN
MLIRYVRMTFQPEKVNEFLAFFEENKQQIRNFPGCNYVEILRDIHQPNVFMTHSHWDSENDLNAYRDSELFDYVWGNTKKLFADKPIAFSMESFMIV